MILGQAEPDWLDITGSALIGGIATSVVETVGAIRRAVTGGGDVEAAAEGDVPQIPETPGDATGVVGAGKTSARKPSASYGDEARGYYSAPATGGASLWPWILGVGLIAGGAYWFVKRKKRSKKGK